jgi:hypothetical protein
MKSFYEALGLWLVGGSQVLAYSQSLAEVRPHTGVEWNPLSEVRSSGMQNLLIQSLVIACNQSSGEMLLTGIGSVHRLERSSAARRCRTGLESAPVWCEPDARSCLWRTADSFYTTATKRAILCHTNLKDSILLVDLMPGWVTECKAQKRTTCIGQAPEATHFSRLLHFRASQLVLG